MKDLKTIAIENGATVVDESNQKELYGIDKGLVILSPSQLESFVNAAIRERRLYTYDEFCEMLTSLDSQLV